MNKMNPSILEVSRPLIGVPCWNASQGYGSFLTFEFGNPIPIQSSVPKIESSNSDSIPNRLDKSVRGEWHLWIYCCDWRISQGAEVIAHSESKDKEIKLACDALEGQSLQGIDISETAGFTGFIFEQGGNINTFPYDDELNEHWILFCPDNMVFTYRSDGAVSYEPDSTEEGNEYWFPGA